MTSFGWKRKAGGKVCVTKSKTFESNAKDEDDVEEINSGEIDWLTLHPKRKCMQLEDAIIKSNRLKDEGTVLATAERYWEALQKWDEAVQLTPDDEKLYEMKAQAYFCVGELYPAMNAARKAVSLSATWWEAHQTLGRAHLQIGEVKMALKSFERALHLHPADEALWKEDLKWAQSLLVQKQQQTLEFQTQNETETERSVQILELNEDGSVKVTENESRQENDLANGKQGQMGTELLHMSSIKTPVQQTAINVKVKALPQNYVYMRD